MVLLFAKIWKKENVVQICAQKFEKWDCKFLS